MSTFPPRSVPCAGNGSQCAWVLDYSLHPRVQQCVDLVINNNKECVLRFLLGTRFGSASTAKKMASTRHARSRSPAQQPTPACIAPPMQTWGKQTQQFVRALPAAKLLELCCWRVSCQLVCEDEDCPCETPLCYKPGRFSTRRWTEHPPEHETRVKAARAELKRRLLCHCCGGKLVPIGDARANGACHGDWPSRRYHKKCWLAAKRGDFGIDFGTPETDVE